MVTSNPDIQYLVPGAEAEHWGLTVTSVGSQVITADEEYPPQNHPKGYFFDVRQGRILDEYQLLYITDGEGTITYGTPPVTQQITEGKMFFLLPGMWHTYRPVENSGWKEYWIGFRGEMVDRLVASGFFSRQAPVFNIGINERIIDLYLKARDIARESCSSSQPALAGIVMHMLGLMYYREHSSDQSDENIIGKVNKAKVLMRENVYENLPSQEVARRLGLGYSGFRKAFKEYAGTSPAQYMKELKVNEAKSLLSTTNRTIKEISYLLKYENPEYFSISFKKRTGRSPMEYRHFARQKQSSLLQAIAEE